MKLTKLKLKNFRCYRNEITVNFDDLTAFVGKNDAGKSSILEALEIFFNNSVVKIEKADLNVEAVLAGEETIEITCYFDQLPTQLIIDAAYPTTLANEHLLNAAGILEIKKVYACTVASPKEQVFIVANHPTVAQGQDLLSLKRAELKARAAQLGVPEANYNGTINSTMRSAIWNFLGELNLNRVEIQVDKDDTKKAWDYINKWMPQFALFKADRESNDGDKEVTDPMKVAINSAISELQAELEEVQEKVREKVVDVANRTLEKLQEMNADLANQLTPSFKSDPKWAGIFSLTLSSDRNIPINKRGSGIRRLVVLNFFRAEAERRRNEKNSQAIIYAFEEPENSQHPNHQAMLIKAFQELSDTPNTQVLLTTHNPALAGLIAEDDLRLVTLNNNNIMVLDKQADILKQIADTLGMLPEPLKPRLLVCVEGPNDIVFLKNISHTLHLHDPTIPNLSTDTRIAIFPLGGGTLKDWVTHDYLRNLNIPQYHIYDLDEQVNPPYLVQRDEVRGRGGNNWAELTSKKELENYIHPLSIQNVFGFPVAFGDMDDVPEIVARTQQNNANPNSWGTLDGDTQKKKMSRVKKRLNNEATEVMTLQQIQAADAGGDIVRWLEDIRVRIEAN